MGKTNKQRESYESLLNYVSTRCGVSYRAVSYILTEFSREMQQSIARGNDVEITSICTIYYVHKRGTIYQNHLETLEDLIQTMVSTLDIHETKVRSVVLTYIKRIHFLIGVGQPVNIKGICAITPKPKDNVVYCDIRLSGVLQKPHQHYFYLLTPTGALVIEQIPEEQLRISVEVSPQLELPQRLVQKEPLQLKTIDI